MSTGSSEWNCAKATAFAGSETIRNWARSTAGTPIRNVKPLTTHFATGWRLHISPISRSSSRRQSLEA